MQTNINLVQNELWNRGYLKFLLWKQQRGIYDTIHSVGAESETVVILCARQFGKSVLGALMAIEDCLRNDDVCVLIIGPTIKQTVEIVAPRIRMLMQTAPEGLIKRTKSENKWYVGNSEIVIGGFDNGATNQRGKTIYRIYIEEVVDSNPDDYHERMRSDLAPALAHSILGQMVFLTTPPKIPDHPFITDTIPEARLNNTYFKYTIDDNDALDAQKKKRLIKLTGGVNSVDTKRELYCEIVRDPTVLLTPDFSEHNATFDYIKPTVARWSITIDFGGVRDHTHVLFHCYNYLNNQQCIDFELHFPANTNTDKIMEQVRNKAKDYSDVPLPIYADAPGQTRVDMQDKGIGIIPVPKSDWVASINACNLGFYNNRIKINKQNCPILIETCRSGTFNKQRTDFARSKALGHMDAMAALSYALKVSNKENPYREMTRPPDNVFVKKPIVDDKQEVANVIGNKFSKGVKKFGSFKR